MTDMALIAVKAALVLLAAGVAARCLRRASPPLRHLVLLAGAAGAILLPALQALLPGWPAVPVSAGVAGVDAGGSVNHPIPLAAWLGGSAILALRLAGSWMAVRRLAVDASDVTDARVLSAAIDARGEVGLGMAILLLTSPRIPAPVSTGIFRHTVLLPPAAVRWSRSRLRAVFLHEFAHLERRDCLTQLVAQVCCVLYWFLPPAWWNARGMCFHREVACDDRVIERGARPSGYAALLVGMLRAAGDRHRTLHAGAALAARHDLAQRIGAVLRRDRGRGPGRRRVLGGLVLAAALLCGLGGLGKAEPAPRNSTAPAARGRVFVSVSASSSAGAAVLTTTQARSRR